MKPKDYNKKQCGTVKMNALVPVIGTIGSLFFGIVLVLTILNNAGFLCYVIFGALFILSIGMILTINQKNRLYITGIHLQRYPENFP